MKGFIEPKLRDSFLRIVNDMPLTPETHKHLGAPLYYLQWQFPKDKIMLALEWLLRNRLTDVKFMEWYQETCEGSNLEMIRHLMKAVERERHLRALTSRDLQ